MPLHSAMGIGFLVGAERVPMGSRDGMLDSCRDSAMSQPPLGSSGYQTHSRGVTLAGACSNWGGAPSTADLLSAASCVITKSRESQMPAEQTGRRQRGVQRLSAPTRRPISTRRSSWQATRPSTWQATPHVPWPAPRALHVSANCRLVECQLRCPPQAGSNLERVTVTVERDRSGRCLSGWRVDVRDQNTPKLTAYSSTRLPVLRNSPLERRPGDRAVALEIRTLLVGIIKRYQNSDRRA
jgi:hypothetical protein